MQKILRIKLSQTRKADFKTLYESVVEIAEKYNLEELHVSETLNKMKEALPQVNYLDEPEIKSPLTVKLNEICNTRDKLASSIYLQLNALLKTGDDATVKAAEELFSLANRTLVHFSRKSLTTQYAHAKQFITEVEESEELKQAVATLGMEATIDKLKKTQQLLNTTDSNRRRMKTMRKKADTVQIKRELYRLMSNFFTAVEGAALEYPSLNYDPLIQELNDVITKQRSKSALRSTLAAKTNTTSSLSIATENAAI
jgi:methionine-rich copper-binding protein CopC